MPSLSKSEAFLRERLKVLRQQTGLSQEGFAEIAGISVIYYQSIERGVRSNVSLRVIEQIATAYGLTVHELFAPKVPQVTPASSPNPPPHRRRGKRRTEG